MSRVINTASPGKHRNAARRTIAEILRHLMLKKQFDDESRDMVAAVVYALRTISETVEVTLDAWEKRDYFLKADRYRLEWEWVTPAAQRLRDVAVAERWEQLPAELAALAPRFADIHIAKMTRTEKEWRGSYQLLLREE